MQRAKGSKTMSAEDSQTFQDHMNDIKALTAKAKKMKAETDEVDQDLRVGKGDE